METAVDPNDQESGELVSAQISDSAVKDGDAAYAQLSEDTGGPRAANNDTITSNEEMRLKGNDLGNSVSDHDLLLLLLDKLEKVDSRLHGTEVKVKEMHQYLKITHDGVYRTGVAISKSKLRFTEVLDQPLQPEKDHISTLRQGFSSLIDNLEPKDIESQLISKRVLSVSDVESIKGEKRRSDRVRQLVCCLCKKSPEHFEHFLDTLRESYDFLAEHFDSIRSTAKAPFIRIQTCSVCILQSEVDIRTITDYMFRYGTITPEVFRELTTKTIPLGVRWAQLLQVVNYEPGGEHVRDTFFKAVMLTNTRIYSLLHQFFSRTNRLECHCPKTQEEQEQLQNVWALSRQLSLEPPLFYRNKAEDPWVRVWVQKSKFSNPDTDRSSTNRENSQGHSSGNREPSSESEDEIEEHRIFHSLSQSQQTTTDGKDSSVVVNKGLLNGVKWLKDKLTL
ncbi:uncharacterized protein LOC121391333 [Gigantopelta aegis]|uniref:uncharacterized protein LOC121391333 n=1 Tax=Gigantopelta aegis TaxID=1735272 RepID=UPI001B88E014|nr:uncharacterized protein LOC121391333 [Gigantopelta aegis]